MRPPMSLLKGSNRDSIKLLGSCIMPSHQQHQQKTGMAVTCLQGRDGITVPVVKKCQTAATRAFAARRLWEAAILAGAVSRQSAQAFASG